MIIKRLKAEGFRNIDSCDISFCPGVNLLYGDNAQGKTNAVEAIYLFARGRSFRAAKDSELVGFGKEGFRLRIEYEDKNGEENLEYALFGRISQRKKNGYKLTRASELVGSFRAVMFSPDDLELVKGSPEERRAFLNVAISQCKSEYIGCYQGYKKALENRNCILKNASKGGYTDQNELIAWSEYMAEYAARIYIMRREYIKKLEVYAADVMRDISGGKEKLSLRYRSDINEEFSDFTSVSAEYRRILTSYIEREKTLGSSLFGPHRDDLEIFIGNSSARSFASQGQQRSVVLSLKLGEGEVSREISGEYPVFLLDDVLSELDDGRKKYLIDGVGKGRQIIITTCDKDILKLLSDSYSVNALSVDGGRYSVLSL